MNLFNLHFPTSNLESLFQSSRSQSIFQNHLITLIFWVLFLLSFASDHKFYSGLSLPLGLFACTFALAIPFHFLKISKLNIRFGLITVGLTASFLYSLMVHYKGMYFESKFQEFIEGLSFSGLEVILANQAANFEHKIIIIIISFCLRFGAFGGFDLNLITSEVLFRNVLYIIGVIYIFYRSEKRERDLFKEAQQTKEELVQMKFAIEHLPSPSIAISDCNSQKCLFSNQAFFKLVQSLDKDMDSTQPSFLSFFKSLEVDKNSIQNSSPTSASLLPSKRTISLYDFIQANKSNNLLSCSLSGSCEIKGSQQLFEITIASIAWDQCPSIMLAFNDITYEKEISNLKQAQEKQNQLIATVSHELRTPLYGVLGLIQIVEPKIKDEETLEYLSLCKDNAHLLMNLVNSLLDNQQIQHGEIKLNPSKIQIQVFLKSILGLFTFPANQKNVTLSAFIDDDVPDEIITDENRLKQILINLVSNALKFTLSGEITIEISQSQESKDHLRFTVSDTGRGIKKDDLSKLFKLYTKIEDKEGLNKQGVGLGLTISNNISKLLGDQDGITVKSQYGSGSTFSFLVNTDLNNILKSKQTVNKFLPTKPFVGSKEYITTQYTNNDIEEFSKPVDLKSKLSLYTSPLIASISKDFSLLKISNAHSRKRVFLTEAVTHKFVGFSPQNNQNDNLSCINFSKKSELKMDHQKGRVLVVDDNYFNLLIAKNLLKDLGYEVQTASSGEKAIEIFQESINNKLPFAFIFMDCQMPLMDGFETTGFLRKIMDAERVEPVPIIALTASYDKRTIEKCYESGMAEHLSKPLAKEDLLKVLHKR